jgi:hypothetical protein
MINSIYFNTKSPTLPDKIAKLLVSIVVVGLSLMFSALLLVIIVTVGAMIWGYLWWKSRDLREQMRQYSSVQYSSSDVVIEGEVIRRESDEHPMESTLEKLENLSSLRSDKQMGTF